MPKEPKMQPVGTIWARRRRGRPCAELDGAKVVRLRDELGMSWRTIGKKLSVGALTARRAYIRTLTTARVYQNSPTPYQKSATAIREREHPENVGSRDQPAVETTSQAAHALSPIPRNSAAPLPVLGSVYARPNTADRLQLKPDGSFILQEAGRAYHGSFSLVLKSPEFRGGQTTAAVQGDSLVDGDGCTWARAVSRE